VRWGPDSGGSENDTEMDTTRFLYPGLMVRHEGHVQGGGAISSFLLLGWDMAKMSFEWETSKRGAKLSHGIGREQGNKAVLGRMLPSIDVNMNPP